MNPADLRYTKDHEWVRLEADGTLTMGITAFAQDALGDIVFADLGKIGVSVTAGASFGVVESVKTVGELYAPCDGTIVAINTAAKANTEVINQDPFGAGWLCRLAPANAGDLDRLLSAAEYDALVASEAH